MKTIEVTPEEEKLILKRRKSPTVYRVGYLSRNLYSYDDEFSLALLSTDIGLMDLEELEDARNKFVNHFSLVIPEGAKFSSIIENGVEIWSPVNKKYLDYIESIDNRCADKYLENISEV